MATKTTGENRLSKIVTCSVCLDPYTEPKTLRCDHSFCKQCVAKIIRAQLVNRDGIFVAKELLIECPNCKTEHGGFRTVSEIRTSHVITQILDFYEETCKAEGPSNESRCIAKCSCCEKPSKCVCLRCWSPYCIPCGKTMLNKPCKENAQVPNINGLEEKQNHCIIAKNGAADADDYVCMEHSLSFDCFCTECEEIICIDCFLTNHADHRTKTIESVKKEAVQLIAHLKSVRDGNIENRKDIEDGAHRVLEKIEANQNKLLADFKQQKLKMQNFISFIFDRAEQSYKNIFAEEKEKLLKEVTDSNTEETYRSFLASAYVPKGEGLSDVCDIGNMKAALAQCQQEEMKIETAIKFLREKEMSEDEISLSINHQEIYKLCLKLFANINLDPASTGKFCPLGITFKTYESVAGVAEGILSATPVPTQANESAATHVHVVEKQHSGVDDRFIPAEALQKIKPKGIMSPQEAFFVSNGMHTFKNECHNAREKHKRIQYDREFLLQRRFWNNRPNFHNMECTLQSAHFTFELKKPGDSQDGEQSIFGSNPRGDTQHMHVRGAARLARNRKKAKRLNENSALVCSYQNGPLDYESAEAARFPGRPNDDGFDPFGFESSQAAPFPESLQDPGFDPRPSGRSQAARFPGRLQDAGFDPFGFESSQAAPFPESLQDPGNDLLHRQWSAIIQKEALLNKIEESKNRK